MRKILLSLLTIGLVSGAAALVTNAYFSDTEQVLGNTFSAGTIDIAVDGTNPWSRNASYSLADMKPGYTDYINFTVQNVGTNPVDLYKVIGNVVTGQGVQSESETAYETANGPRSDVDSVINYDLYVEVYNGDPNAGGVLQWHQMLYDADVTIANIKGTNMYLGMIPEGWYMKVYQSYHMQEATENWAQGDTMTFDLTLNAEQLKGSLVLENKTGDPNWDIIQGDSYMGTLSYNVTGPKFTFAFTGVAPSASTQYALVIGNNPWDAGQLLGTAMSDGSGNVSISGDVDLNTSYEHAKVWLIYNSDWAGDHMIGWHGGQYLYETGLIEYRDTDL